MIKNNCPRYEHLDGYPLPESKFSCRGCKYSGDPNRYDPGCTNPDENRRRKSEDASRRKSTKRTGQPLTVAERRRVDKLLARVNDANRGPWRPPNVEIR